MTAKKISGTKEWSVKSVNILAGCTHRCRYCYARATALKYKRIVDPEEWGTTYHTLRDKDYRLRAQVGVTYGSDMREVRRVLEEVAKGVEWRKMDREPVVLLVGFGDSSVDWEVSVWIDDPWKIQQLRSALNEIIWWALKVAGITIAFPQLDLHFDPKVTESIVRDRNL